MINNRRIELVKKLVGIFVEKLLEYHKDRIISIILFGSYARGNFKSTSDIDILIIMENLPKSRFKRYKLIVDAIDYVENIRERLAGLGIYTGISPVILDLEEAKYFRPLYLDLVYDSIILYDKNNFFKNLMKRVSEYINKFQGKRIWIGNRWYWIFKKGNIFIELDRVKLIE